MLAESTSLREEATASAVVLSPLFDKANLQA